MSEALWSFEGVCLAGTQVLRLDGLVLQIGPGVTAVMGCSGAGKTSLLNLLVGFERPDRGTITQDPPTGFSLPLYWAPQDGGLWPHLTAQRHLEAVAPSKASKEAIAAMLDSFDIGHKMSSYPGELSMGERCRLSVARALMAGAAVLVMDEPLAHVDEARAGRYWQVIRDHVANTGASLVFATHSPKLVLSEAEQVVCLKEGRVLYAGKVDELYWNPASQAEAECLGEVNWLETDEARLWFGDGAPARHCYRPEQVLISLSANGPLIVKSSRFRGSVAETDLLHERTGRERRFYHRPRGGELRGGVRVVLRALLVLLLVVLAGCGGQQDPVLMVQEVHYWQMPPDGPRIPAPRSLAVGPEDDIFALDTAGRVLVFDATGTVKRQWPMPKVDAGKPEGIRVLKSGRVAVADTHYSRVVLFDQHGRALGEFGRHGTGPGEFIYPVAIVQDERENIYVCEYGSNDRVQKFSPQGAFLLSFGSFGTGPGQFQRPSGVAWHEGKLYVADAINGRIQVFSDTGQFLGVLGTPRKSVSFSLPYGITIGPDAALYVIEYGPGRVSKVNLQGRLIGRYGGMGKGDAQFRTPWGIAVDSRMRLRIADTGNRRIAELKL